MADDFAYPTTGSVGVQGLPPRPGLQGLPPGYLANMVPGMEGPGGPQFEPNAGAPPGAPAAGPRRLGNTPQEHFQRAIAAGVPAGEALDQSVSLFPGGKPIGLPGGADVMAAGGEKSVAPVVNSAAPSANLAGMPGGPMGMPGMPQAPSAPSQLQSALEKSLMAGMGGKPAAPPGQVPLLPGQWYGEDGRPWERVNANGVVGEGPLNTFGMERQRQQIADQQAIAAGKLPSFETWAANLTKGSRMPGWGASTEQKMQLLPLYLAAQKQEQDNAQQGAAGQIEREKLATQLGIAKVTHEADAGKDLRNAQQNAYVAGYNEVKARGGSDAEAHDKGIERIQQVVQSEQAVKGMRAGVQGNPGQPGVQQPGGEVIARETDPLVRGLFEGPKGESKGIVQPGKIDLEQLLPAFAGVKGKMTPQQMKGIGQYLVTNAGGAKQANQILLDELAHRMAATGTTKEPGGFQMQQGSYWGSPRPKLTLTNSAFPGFQSQHRTGISAPITLPSGMKKYQEEIPLISALLGQTLPYAQGQ